MRRASRILAWLGLGLALSLGVAVLLLPRIELGPLVAGRAAAALDRRVEIGSLRIVPGRDVRIVLRDLRLANIEGGSAPEMARLDQLRATVALLPLLGGALVVREAEAEGLALLLERNAQRVRNWRFGSGEPRPRPARPPALPLVHALRLAGGGIVVRTSGGASLTTRIDTVRLAAADPLVATVIAAEGSYNGAPITARIDVGPLAELRQGRPLALKVHGRSGDTTLDFEGTARDPLNADGAEGRFALGAPTPDALLRMAQLALPISLDFTISGAARRDGTLWQIRQAAGTLSGSPFTASLLELREGGAGEPDAIAATLAFERIDLNRVLGPGPPDDGAATAAVDMPLIVPAVPDPRLDVRVAAAELAYAGLAAREVRLAASQHPGRIAVDELLLSVFGARVEASGQLEPADAGARLVASARMLDGDLDALGRAFGARPLPVSGPLQARFAITSEGATFNQAFDQAHVTGVVAMTGGRIAREVIEMASTDIRALFRTARGTTPLSCLLAVVDMQDRRGEVAPLRIRAGTGTIVGQASFDLDRQWIDLVIGTERDSTHLLALDVPVRVTGRLSNPEIALADWSPASRARLGAGDDISGLPAALADFARASACFQPPRRR